MKDDAPIFGFNAAREDIVRSVVSRVVLSAKDPLLALNDAAYHETKRLEASKRGPEEQKELAEWQKLARSLGRMGDGERREKLASLVEHMGWDVAGNFDPRVFKVSSKLLPPVVTSLLAPRTLVRLARDPKRLVSLSALDDKVRVEGPVEELRELSRHGTAVYVPTHLSNMDSIVFGYALERAGLPPATYGAGKNLFTNPVLSFFMHNLGAYRVDRRIRHNLYKDVLKTYSCVLLERGYHSLFFPGGTRSRSGGVERRLKLGLMGTAIEAYARTLIANRERRVYFVPATINYLITLEAETLIADFLAEAGKGRFIIEDDESSRLGRVTSFMRKMFDMQGAVVIRFGKPIDPFGNVVDERCRSFDRRGREVDPSSYVKDDGGRVTLDPVRDAQYTRELGDEICKAYLRETVVLETHVVAAASFERLRRASPAGDLFTVLRQRDVVVVPRDDLARDVVKLRDRLVELADRGEIVVGGFLRTASGGDIVERALRAFAGYHASPVLASRPDGIAIADTNLLFYYQNRLAAHGMAWDVIAPPGMAPARPPVFAKPASPEATQGGLS
ncbi:1-acyl-sn-glycerol-3-phosphate acyltransferase [Polyangium sp. 6x1]|uniref:1-acyl-sn-glycerol-3-phosphate acyltransferase n=1 Tax=Polyangium sp. 6x1 TaxID=3042689 RepID=UPI0024823CD0|nr:1-acyl-sn-glycerol-3-phosphate acyltransferase [Polyangium sp. 6x1]MDI1449518.1 1-acyl-sn-glycerol-3-phosphate acyltransferase [Polyangium sp. 6x1]